MRSQFARIFDITVSTLALGLVCFAWVRKYIKNIYLSIALTALIAFIIFKVLWLLSTKIANKKEIKIKDLSLANACFDYFAINKKEALEFFSKLFNAKIIDDNFLENEDSIYYINYSCEKIETDTISQIVSKKFDKKVLLMVNSISTKAIGYVHQLNYKCYLPEEVFDILKEQNIYPTTMQKTAKSRKLYIKNMLISALDKKKAKHYILYGVLLISISFIVPFTFWYVVSGTIFVMFGLLSLLIKTKQLS